MRIALLDNLDSFTYNLVHYLEAEGAEVNVVRIDQMNWAVFQSSDAILISPGPGAPDEAKLAVAVLEKFHHTKPIIGVCLGFQVMALHFGSRLVNLTAVLHGVSSMAKALNPEDPLFSGITWPMQVGHYHSWGCYQHDLLAPLTASSLTNDGLVMSFKHRSLPLWGVQYHPESVLTPQGKTIIANWLRAIK